MQNNVLMLGNFPQLINSRFAGSPQRIPNRDAGVLPCKRLAKVAGVGKAVVNTDDDTTLESTVQGAHFAEFKA